jgi:carboxymethylenebutenolidase
MKKIYLTLVLFLAAGFVMGQAHFLEKLQQSPRHHEWADVVVGNRKVRVFVAFPEVAAKATAVVLIHENRGLNDWARYMADQLAGAGFVVVAPDLLSGTAPGGGNTDAFPNEDEARKAIYTLAPEQVTADLQAVTQYAAKIPAANGKVAVAGFCWGGSQSFRFANDAQKSSLKAAFVFYGSGADKPEQYQQITIPVYGFYGENDQRVNATIAVSEQLMKGKTFQYEIYPGAGHGFMRSGQDLQPTPENAAARDKAFNRFVNLLKAL